MEIAIRAQGRRGGARGLADALGARRLAGERRLRGGAPRGRAAHAEKRQPRAGDAAGVVQPEQRGGAHEREVAVATRHLGEAPARLRAAAARTAPR